MSGEVKIALGIGAVAIVGYFVVTSLSKPSVVPKNTAPGNTNTTFVSGIVSGFNSVANLFKSAPANAPLANIGDPYLNQSDYNSIREFRSESPDMTDAQRDAAILG